MKTNTPFASRTEDTFKSANLGAPSALGHVATHPKADDSTLVQVYKCKDILENPHFAPVNLAKALLKGAAIGGFVGCTIGVTAMVAPSLVWKKAAYFVDKNPYGNAYIIARLALPYGIMGAAFVGGHHVWYNEIWRKESKNDLWYDLMAGNAIYGAGVSMCLFGPKYWWAGMYAGALLGFGWYHFAYSNFFSNKDTMGYVTYYDNGMTEEDRQKQKYKDYIHYLSLFPVVQKNKLEEI